MVRAYDLILYISHLHILSKTVDKKRDGHVRIRVRVRGEWVDDRFGLKSRKKEREREK